MKIIKNIDLYAPEHLGICDVLIEGSSFGVIKKELPIPVGLDAEVIDGTGKLLVPGFVDAHVHILGGGGEGGYHTRTPELMLSSMIQSGVTTVVGVLGTDGVSRTMTNLIAKAKGLKNEGVSCYLFSGSYDVPVRTLLGNIREDILLIEEIIGVGEIAISDHRSSQPTQSEIERIAADARVGGMLAGKAGIVQIHMGDGEARIDMLNDIVRTTTLPITQFMPTHVNRNKKLFSDCIDFAKRGGPIDLTISPNPACLHDDEVKCSTGLKICLDAGVPIERISFSSDGQGSLPLFDENKQLVGLGVGDMTYLVKEVADAVLQEKIPLETAIRVITQNPATTLKLKNKGQIKQGFDADFVILDTQTYEIHSVGAMGCLMMHNNQLLRKGTFEK